MAYIVISHRDEELGRQNLTSSMTVGRSPECDISWHDILLSRKHCRVEFFKGSWTLVDLTSKNGTFVNGLPISGRRVLKNSDEITIGRIKIVFRSGVVGVGGRRKVRPADPWEAMEGTVSAFELDESPGDPNPVQRDGRPRPTPRPAPQAPRGYEREGVGRLVRDMLSDEHDAAAQERRAPDRVRPAPIVRRTAPPPAAQTHNIEPESHFTPSLMREAFEAELEPSATPPKRPRAPGPVSPVLRQLTPPLVQPPMTDEDAEARLRLLVAESARAQGRRVDSAEQHPAEFEQTGTHDMSAAAEEARQPPAALRPAGNFESAGTLEEPVAAFQPESSTARSVPEPVVEQIALTPPAPPVPSDGPEADYHGLLAAPTESTSSTIKDDATTVSATAPADLPLQVVDADARLAPVVELAVPAVIEESPKSNEPPVVVDENEVPGLDSASEPEKAAEPMKGLRGEDIVEALRRSMSGEARADVQESIAPAETAPVELAVSPDGGHVSSAEYVDLYLTRDEAEANSGSVKAAVDVRSPQTAQENSFSPSDVESLAAEALGLPKHSAVVVTQSPIMEAGMSMIESDSAVVDEGPMMSPDHLTRSLNVAAAPVEGVDEATIAALKETIEGPAKAAAETPAVDQLAVEKAAKAEEKRPGAVAGPQSLEELSAAAAAATPFPLESEIAPRKRRIISLRPKFLRGKSDTSANGEKKAAEIEAPAPGKNGVAAARAEAVVADAPVVERVIEPVVETPVVEAVAVEAPVVKKPRVVELKPRKLSAKGADVPLPSPASAGRKVETKAEAAAPMAEEAPVVKKARVVELKPRKLGSKPQSPVTKAEQPTGENLRWPWQARREQEKTAGQKAEGRGPRSAQMDAAGMSAEDEEAASTAVRRSPTAAAAELNTQIVESKVRQVDMKPGKAGGRTVGSLGKTTQVEVKPKGGDPRLQTADALLQKLLQLSPDASTRRSGGVVTEEARAVDFWVIAAMVVGCVVIYLACSTIF